MMLPVNYFDYLGKDRMFQVEHEPIFIMAHELAAVIDDLNYDTYVHMGVIHPRNGSQWYITVARTVIHVHKNMNTPYKPFHLKRKHKTYEYRNAIYREVCNELRGILILLSRDI